MDVEYSIYLGQEQKNGFTGFLSEKNFFCVVEIFDGYTNEQGEQLMSALAEVGNTHFESLVAFDSTVSDILKNLNTPLDTSIAVGYRKNLSLYLKTVGTGEIYIGRGKTFERIIHGTVNAAGKYAENDFYMFTTSFFTQSLKGTVHTKTLLHSKTSTRDFPERIKQTIGADDDTGAVALFVKMIEHQGTYVAESPGNPIAGSISDFIKQSIQTINSLDMRKKIVIGALLLICIALFGWNLSKGIQNRGGIQIGQGQSYSEKKQQIEELILKSEELPALYEVQNQAALLAKTAPKDKQQEVIDLNKKIQDLESKLLKRTFVEPHEYYDFGLEEKNAVGTKLSLFEDKAYVLNPAGKVYILTLEKKSLLTIAVPKKMSAESLVAGYENNTYVLDPTIGITRIDEEGKAKTVIPKETQWMSINGMHVYNGNIYLLDGGNNALYKYPVTTDGYGDRVSYFKGSYMDMDTTSSFAIDIAVYVTNKEMITKYTAGLKDDFKLEIPGKNREISKIITHTDQTDLYMWDKKNKVLYITTRDGAYKKQVSASLFGQAVDVEVYNNKAYLLKGAKLYSVDL